MTSSGGSSYIYMNKNSYFKINPKKWQKAQIESKHLVSTVFNINTVTLVTRPYVRQIALQVRALLIQPRI